MCKEFLSLHIGQAGVQSSHALWELVCIEHGISADGILRDGKDESYTGENIEAMYYEIKNSRFVPRAILIDLEPTVVDEVRMGSYRDLWNPANIINQKEDAASNYARGYYTSGKSFITVVIDRINRELERCDNLSAFEIVHSFAGGTGSGFTALTYETISELYGKKFRFSLGVFPSPTLSEIMVESFNTVLHTSSTLTTEDCVVIFDNESLFKKSLDKLNVSQPTFCLMNRLVSQMFSSISLSHRYRFFGSQHADVTELLTNLVPYPKIHFPTMSYSPLITFTQQSHEQYDCAKLTSDVFQDDSHVLQCSLRESKFMSCCMLFRGDVSPKPIIDAIAKIKRSRDISFVDWCPTGFKIGINPCPPIQIPQCEQAIGDNALCMISGNTAIRSCWSGILRKFDMLMSKRAFVHWYVAEGLEEGEFVDARDNIKTLILDYEELASDVLEGESIEDLKPASNTQTNTANKNSSDTLPFNITDHFRSLVKVDKIYKSQHNQSYCNEDISRPLPSKEVKNTKRKISEKTEKVKKENLSRQTDHLNSKENDYRLIQKGPYTYKENVNKPIAQKSINKGIHVTKKTKKIVNEKDITEIKPVKRNRYATRDLDIEEIGRTVAKYLNHRGKSPTINSSSSKDRNLSYTRSDSKGNLSTSRSFTIDSSSKADIIETCKLMRNNNKGQSVYNSSTTGSYKTAFETQNKSSIGFVRKSKGKFRSVNESLQSSIDTKQFSLNVFEICNGLGKNFENIISVESRKSVGKSNLTIKRHSSLDVLPKDEKVIILLEEPVNEIENVAHIDTKMSQHFKMQNLDFSNYETVSCDPMFFIDPDQYRS